MNSKYLYFGPLPSPLPLLDSVSVPVNKYCEYCMKRFTRSDCGLIDVLNDTAIHAKCKNPYKTTSGVINVNDGQMNCTIQIAAPDNSTITATSTGNNKMYDAIVTSDNGSSTVMTVHQHKKPHLHREPISISGKQLLPIMFDEVTEIARKKKSPFTDLREQMNLIGEYMKYMRVHLSKYPEGVSRIYLYCVLPNNKVMLLLDIEGTMTMHVHEHGTHLANNLSSIQEKNEIYSYKGIKKGMEIYLSV
jgi:hypothetical protein